MRSYPGLFPNALLLPLPLLRSPKSIDPLFSALLIAEASVFENYTLYGSLPLDSFIKLFCDALGCTLNYSSKLELYFGLIVRPKLYFSPDGDRGGVKPFWVGDPGAFYTFVINNGEGVLLMVAPDLPDYISLSKLFSSLSVDD